MTIAFNGRPQDGDFVYAAYRETYRKQKRPRGNATLPQKRALFCDAKRRLEHGVPVSVLIRDMTLKLRAFTRQNGEVA